MLYHDVIRYRYTLITYPYLHHNCKHDIHEVVQHFYRFQIVKLIIFQTFCFLHFDLYLWGVWDKYHAMVTRNNSYFCQIYSIHNHTIVFIGQSSSLVGGGNILRNVESMMLMLFTAYIAYFSPPSSGIIIILLCSSLADTFNKNFGTNCGHAWLYIDNLIK